MSIGLTKSKIESKLKEIFLEELTPHIGVLAQEKIATAIAGIIVENNRQIESEFNNKIQQLESKIRY